VSRKTEKKNIIGTKSSWAKFISSFFVNQGLVGNSFVITYFIKHAWYSQADMSGGLVWNILDLGCIHRALLS